MTSTVTDIQLTRFAPGDLKVIHGQGMPSQRHHEPGDLYVKIHVKFPDSLDQNKVHLLESVLPPRNPVEKFPKAITSWKKWSLTLPTRGSESGQLDDTMDEDEGEPRVQCSNQ
jgi:DnaJ family protein A protein 2